MKDDFYQLAHLANGHCHYRLSGPANAAFPLLIHGATVPMWEFDRLTPYFHDAGFATLQLDLYGHGYSARPRTCYTLDLFAEQVENTLAELRLEHPAFILGHSLGAAIATRLLQRGRISTTSLILAAPLVDFIANMPAGHLLKIPLVGELLVPGLVIPFLKRRRARKYAHIGDGRFANWFERQLQYPGFDRALLSLFRTNALRSQHKLYEGSATILPKTLVVRGNLDTVVTSDQIRALLDLLPQANSVEVHGTGHPFMLTHPERAAPPMLEFLEALHR